MSLFEIAVKTQKCNGLLIIVHLQTPFFWSLLVKTFNISPENTASMGQKMSPKMVGFKDGNSQSGLENKNRNFNV